MNSVLYYPITLISSFLLLQIPQGVPHPSENEPLILETPFDYILYVGMPILILLGFLLWRRRNKQRAKEREEKNKNL